MGSIVTSYDYILARLGLTDPDANQLALIDAATTQAEGAVKQYLGYDPVQRTRKEIYTLRDTRRMQGAGYFDITSTHAFVKRSSRTAGLQIILKHLPIRSIESLKISYDARHGTAEGAFEDAVKTEGVDFWPAYDCYDDDNNKVCKSGILRSHGLWPAEAGAIEVEYVAGYTAAEFAGQAAILDASPIAAAVTIEAARRATEAFLSQQNPNTGFTAGNVVSERLGDYSYSLGGTASGTTTSTQFGGSNDILPETRTRLSGFVNYGWMLSP